MELLVINTSRFVRFRRAASQRLLLIAISGGLFLPSGQIVAASIYASAQSLGKVVKIDTVSRTATDVLTSVDTPRGIAFTPDGSQFYLASRVTGQNQYRVSRYSSTGVLDPTFSRFFETITFNDLAVDSNGNLHVAIYDGGLGKILKINPLGISVGSYVGTTNFIPYDIEFASNGKLLVSDLSINRVIRLNTDLTFDVTFAALPAGTTGIAIDSGDRVYISQGIPTAQPIRVYDAAGVFLNTITVNGSGRDLEFGPNGLLFSLDPPDIEEYDPLTGAQTLYSGARFFSGLGTLNGAEFMEFQLIPEPAADVLLSSACAICMVFRTPNWPKRTLHR
jgi:hypothetical protein